MSEDIIKPGGDDLMWYLNHGYAICNKCGAVMRRREDPEGGCDIYTCPACGWEVDEFEYEYEEAEDAERIITDEFVEDRDDPPRGCIECDGPYPDCKSSCKMFDD